ncbi:polymer-forming cytoskeletal protein [Massilia sp. CFBP9012]|uniref:polymer-forming cytoskeletal protein n=1 Tax=Massilia sp. CFBP9012 TaxID=3096531 RepID=UPI002A69E684|nr:polymer-forming cytoskeletal protein [Massilia sp. CFBP9012]MDY0975855.1 polymer-forming cytoskeletal protein [Massilia sp. CFBP9012]
MKNLLSLGGNPVHTFGITLSVRFLVLPLPVMSALIHAARRWLPLCLLAFALCAAQSAHAGTTYRFGGPKVDNCKQDKKVYTCTAFPLTAWDDAMIIENGYTVDFTISVTFGYNHSLTMSGNARLTSSGDLHIGDIRPSGTLISGGSFQAGGKFTIGNQNQKITADITAGSMQLGSGSQLEITGVINASGPVAIASHARINGPITGSDITTSSPVVLNGKIDAKNGRFTLASGSTVNGDVTALVADLLASNSVVTGKVTATQTLTLGSSVTVNGNVDTGVLTLQSSEAIIKGTAIVDRADLFWHGRVAELIECRKGATVSDCSCVNNQSGYPFNSTLGPKCGQVRPPEPSPLNHFRIEHDGEGRTCAPETVTIKACANANCTEYYKGGAQVTLLPGGPTVNTGSTGVVSAQLSNNKPGDVSLALTQNGSKPTFSCFIGATSSCTMKFSSGVSFEIVAPDHRAGESAGATIRARELDPATGQCAAAFRGETKSIAYSCRHMTKSSDQQGLSVTGVLTKASATLRCDTGGAGAVSTKFDATGKADLTLNYKDAGTLNLKAEFEDASGEDPFTVAPSAFLFSDLPTTFVRAGDTFGLTVKAVNVAGDVTPSFDKTLLGSGATNTALSVACVAKGAEGKLAAAGVEFNKGIASASLSWSEVGSMDVKAKLDKFLGSGIDVEGTTAGNGNGCLAKVGPFIPKYFQVDGPIAAPGAARAFYYAGEPIPVTVTAMNAHGGVTTNYSTANSLSAAVTLTAFDTPQGTENPGSGVLKATAVPASAFSAGMASARPEYWPAGATPIAVKGLVLRAASSSGVAPVTSADGKGTYEKARPDVHSGRLRIGNAFGRAGDTVGMPVEAHYWTGKSWLFNQTDNATVIPAGAFAQLPYAKGGGAGGPQVVPVGKDLKIEGGRATLERTGDKAGWIDVALNLGVDKKVLACGNASYPDSTGAQLAYLRLPAGCRDPSARAVFGEQSPENRRIIHMREVFN